MKQDIYDFLRLKDQLKSKLKEYVKDKSIPLEDRWNLFIDSELGDKDIYYFTSKVIDLDKFYDNKERHSLITMDWLVDWHESRISPEVLNEFKEEVLEQFIYSFTYDW